MRIVIGELYQILLQNCIVEKARSAFGYFGTVLFLFQKYCTKNNKEKQTLLFLFELVHPPVPLSANDKITYKIFEEE